MASDTLYYKLQKLVNGESFRLNGYKYTNADRDLIDRVLYLGAEGHHHTGEAGGINEPTAAPSLVLSTTGGLLPAGSTIRYKYTYVNERGEETIASPEAAIVTAAAIQSPGTPVITYTTTGGVLLPGNYYYILSAYVDSNTIETQAQGPGYTTIPAGSNFNKTTLILPTLPAGATGFNVYRRSPSKTKYFYLDSIDMDVITPPTTYVDDGSVVEDCDRTVPVNNNTNAQNSVTVSLPGSTPSVPANYTWRIYRTYVSGNYTNSFLTWVVELTSESLGTVVTSYLDTGTSTAAGQPPLVSQNIGSPAKIDLGSEVQGTLSPTNLVWTNMIEFGFAGTLAVTPGEFVWFCEHDKAKIVGVRAVLGPGSSPVATPVIIDVNKGSGQNPTFSTIFSTQANRPRILVGNSYSSLAVPNTVFLEQGDQITVDIDQVGGSATPNDQNLTVFILIWVGSDTDPDITWP